MKKYTISCSVEQANGWQSYTVLADNEADAIKRFNSGEAEFDCEEVEVYSLGEPEVTEVSEI